MSIKSVIKSMLPQYAVDYAHAFKEQIQLGNIPNRPFPLANLKPINGINLQAIFNDPQIEKDWEEDLAAIKPYFPLEDVFGGVNPGDRRALYYLVRALKPQNILETGTHIGASTLCMAMALKRNGSGKIITCDIYDVNDNDNGSWRQQNLARPIRQTMEMLGLGQIVHFQVGDGYEFIKTTPETFDLIFLDGNHAAPAVYNEVSASLHKLNASGIILLHDYYPDGKKLFPKDSIIYGPYLAMRRVKAEHIAINTLPLGKLPWPTKQGVSLTSLAMVVRY